jgi:hypothetical protein
MFRFQRRRQAVRWNRLSSSPMKVHSALKQVACNSQPFWRNLSGEGRLRPFDFSSCGKRCFPYLQDHGSRAGDLRCVELSLFDFEGDVIRLPKDEREDYPGWLDAIGAAERHIRFESHIIHEDEAENENATDSAGDA